MVDDRQRLRRVRAIALLLTGLSLLVVVLSAYLRLDGAGLGCADWPACYAKLLSEPQEQRFGVARLLHRTFASLSLLVTCLLVWQCWKRPALVAPARPATLLLLLMLSLSALGIWSSDPRQTLVGFLNIVGGLGLVSFSWRVAMVSGAYPASQARATTMLRLGAAALSITVMLGGLIGAGYALLACTTFPSCAGGWWPAASDWAAMHPFTSLRTAPSAADPGGAGLHLLHRYAAVAALVMLSAAAIRRFAANPQSKAPALLLALLACEIALGILIVLGDFPLWLAVGHDAVAALLLATLATLLHR